MARPLAEYRADRFMTVSEFADFLGVAADTIYRIQRGERPRVSTIRKIAERLQVHPNDIAEFTRKRGESKEDELSSMGKWFRWLFDSDSLIGHLLGISLLITLWVLFVYLMGWGP